MLWDQQSMSRIRDECFAVGNLENCWSKWTWRVSYMLVTSTKTAGRCEYAPWSSCSGFTNHRQAEHEALAWVLRKKPECAQMVGSQKFLP